MEISKELLGEVLFGGRVEIKSFGVNENTLDYSMYCSLNEKDGTDFNESIPDNYYVVKRHIYDDINISELGYKIEDWIESKDINVIRIKENKLYEFYINAYIEEETNELFFENSITSETKIKGIIAVGEFILKEINGNK